MPSCSFVCCDLTTGGTSQRYFTPGSYPPTMSYYPPVSLYPTPDQFHRGGVMPPIPGSNSDGPAPFLLPPKAHPPPVAVVPHVSPPIRSPESPEPSRKPVVIPPPVMLRPPQPEWQAVEIQTSSPPHEGSPIHPPRAPRSRSRSRREPSSRTPSPRRSRGERSPRTPSSREPRRTRSSRERSPPIQRAVGSDADSYSPPVPHLHMKPLAQVVTLVTDFPSSPPVPVPPLSPRRLEIDEAPHLNVSTTLARPPSPVQPHTILPPPVQRPVDWDADSYSPPSPHLLEKALARRPAPSTDSSPSSPSGSPRKLEADQEPQLNVSMTLARPTSSVQPNPNSPQAPPPPVQTPVDSDADSYLAPSPHLRAIPLADSAPSTDSSQHSPSGSPRMPAADEEPQLDVSTTVALGSQP